MYNRKAVLITAFLLLAAGTVLTAVLPESKLLHITFHVAVVSVILLSLYLSVKDIVITVLFVASVIWSLGFFGVLENIGQLIVETAVLLLCAAVLGWYDLSHRLEKEKQETIVEYKQGQLDELNASVNALKRDNEEIHNKIKVYRKKFTS